jgi:hypothetical protein
MNQGLPVLQAMPQPLGVPLQPGMLVFLLLLAIWTATGCTTALERPLDGACSAATPAQAAAAADRWLRLVSYAPTNTYDVGKRGEAVPVPMAAPAASAKVVLSYPDPERHAGGEAAFTRLHNRSFAYDNALAVFWLLTSDRPGLARDVLHSLVALQRADGAWGFGFAAQGDGFVNASYVRAGTVAWVVYAFAVYQTVTGDTQFAPSLRRGVRWLLAQRRPPHGLIEAGRGRWVTAAVYDPDWIAAFAATEHQIDAWFALRAVEVAEPYWSVLHGVAQERRALAEAMKRVLWLPDERRFAQGADANGLDRGSALDAAGTWGALWWLALGDDTRALQALRYAEIVHAHKERGWQGLRPYLTEPPATWFVEGSVAAALANLRLKRTGEATAQLVQLAQLACAAGPGLVYALDWYDDFPFSPAAGPTLWYLLTSAEAQTGESGLLWRETDR